MKLSVTNAIRKPAQDRFHELMLAGAFPEVEFKLSDDTVRGTTRMQYSLVPYTTVWARFMKCLDGLLKAEVDAELGVFTRKHSAKTIAKLQEILGDMTEEQVNQTAERFSTWVD